MRQPRPRRWAGRSCRRSSERSSSPIAPVTRPAEVPSELSAWRSPAFTDSLSHAVVDTAPGGLVDGDGAGLGHPTYTSVPAPELTLLPPPRPTAVQRSVRPGAAAPGPAARPSTAIGSVAEPPTPSLTRAPSVGMPLVHRAVVDDPTPEPLPEPLPEPASPEQVEPAAAESPTAPVDDAPTVDQPVDPSVPPLGRAVAPSPEPLAAAGVPGTVQRSVDTPLAPTTASEPSATPVVESRRPLGLGPPLATAPVTAVPEPPADAGSDRAPQPAERPGASGFTEIPIQRAVSPAASSPVPPTSPAVPPRPDLTLPPAPGAIEPIEATEPDEPDEPATLGRRRPRRSRVRGRSLGRRPDGSLRDAHPARGRGREGAGDPGGRRHRSRCHDASLTPRPPCCARRDQPGAGRVDVGPAAAGRGSEDVDPAVVRPPRPRHAGADPGRPPRPADPGPAEPRAGRADPADAGRRAAVPAGPAHRVVCRGCTDRRSGAARPTRPVRAWVPRRPRRVRRGSHRCFSGRPRHAVARRRGIHRPLGPTALDGGHAPASVLPPGAPATASPRAASGVLPLARSATDAVPSRAAAVDVEPATEPGVVDISGGSTPWTDASSALDAGQVVVARAEDPAAVADSAPAAAVGGASGGGPPKAAAGSEDVDALAQRLFPPMLRRLKNEFLLDRERRGIRTDAW